MSAAELNDLALLREAFRVHVATEEGSFALLHEQLSNIATSLQSHVAEHRSSHARWVGLAFTLVGAAVLAVGSWLRGIIHIGR